MDPAPLSRHTPSIIPTPAAVGHPVLDVIRGELERVFSLDELTSLATTTLGLNLDEVGGTSAKGSFARALVDDCARRDAVEALVDAVIILKDDLDPRVREIAANGLAPTDELTPNTEISGFTIIRKIGEGGAGVVYLSTRKDAPQRQLALKVLKREACRDLRALQRYLTANRLVGTVNHPGLPKIAATGAFEDGRSFVAYDYVDGQTLAARLGRTGPMHLNEARPILRSVLEALGALHGKRLAHGDLKTENVILTKGEGGAQKVVLLDFGTDRLRARGRAALHQTGILAVYGSAKAMAPELVRGHVADSKSDVYAFGSLLYEVLTGKALFAKEGLTSLEVALAHLSQNPEPPSAIAPRGWVSKDLDAFVLELLKKDATARPADAAAVADAFDRLGRGASGQVAAADRPKLSEEEVAQRIAALVAKPEDGDAAADLEKAIELGADPVRVAEGFEQVASVIDDDKKTDVRLAMLFRAARIFESGKALDRAEAIYKRLLDANAEDDIARAALEEIKKQAGQWNDLVEMLLARVETVHHGRERASVYAEIARLYENELEDPDNAFVAYVQAWCEEPRENDYARDVERLAGSDEEKWDEALGQGAHKVQIEGVSTEDKLALFVQMGQWFVSKVNRLDLALPAFQAAIQIQPSHEGALEGLCEVYRRAQQWPELGAVLLRRADAAPTPGRARDLRAQAAEILESKLSDSNKAKDLFEAIIAEDPGHAGAVEGLERICTRTGDHAGTVRLLEARVRALGGADRADALARIGEIYEDHIGDLNEAVKRFESVLSIDPRHLGALKGLDRIYSRQGRYEQLLGNLERQVEMAATPRQKIGLLERIAGIYDEEFLDHTKAAHACEAILKIDATNDTALVSIGRHYRALDRWEDVVSVYDRHLRVIEDDARRVEMLLARGRVLSEQIGSPERAMQSFEKVLEINSEHAGALEALARLRETAGDANSAVAAVEALAAKATTPEARAEQYVRAARLLEGRGDKDGAIERYKLALDANPADKGAAASLRAAYAARGDVGAAIAMIEKEVSTTDSPLQKARLYAEMAKLAREKLEDEKRARDNAGKALDHDPTNVVALTVLGELAYEAGRYVEAAQRLEPVVQRADGLTKDEQKLVLTHYVDALARTGATEKAVKAVDRLRTLAPDDPEALRLIGQVTFAHGDPRAALEIHREVIEKFGDKFTGADRAEIMYRLGESARKLDDLERAELALDEAVELDPTHALALEALAKVHETRGTWAKVIVVKRRLLDLASGDDRLRLMVECGDILAQKVKDRTGAAKQYVAALDQRPDDRGILLKLMQLYSEGENWAKLVEVVLRLAEFNPEPAARGKYLMTAAIVTERQLKDHAEAASLYERVVDADASNEKALDEAIRLRKAKSDHAGLERLLKLRVEQTKKTGDRAAQLSALDALGELYHRHLGLVDEAIESFERAQALDPENRERNEVLANIYASDPSRFLDKAVRAQGAILKRNPYRAESFKLLRKLYTQSKRADAAWCMCQVLANLNLAEPDEERFFRRHKSETAAPAQAVLGAEDWLHSLRHPDRDPLLTAVFATIEPAIIASRGVTLQSEGYSPGEAIDVQLDEYPMSQTIYYACGVLGMDVPLVFHNPKLEAGLAYVHANQRALVLGRAALEHGDIPPQALAFVAAQKLAFFRPGMYVRQLVSTGTGLKAWLFGAIKSISPTFPVAAELEGPVQQAMAALKSLHPTAKEQLASLVARMLQGGTAIDLKKWIAACDLTADRAGMLLAHDFEVALALIKASEDQSVGVPSKDRQRELILFATSEDYFVLREKLGIAIDS